MATQSGAILPVTVVTDRQVLQGPIQRIFNAADSSRQVAGGASIPIVVAPEDTPRKIMAGPAIPMLNLITRKVRGGPALLVYPVDENGAYDSGFEEEVVELP